MKPIFLVGFMGAGKTTLGKQLAAIMKKGFIDLDEEIEKRTNKSISELVLQEGIEEFRIIERDLLLSINTQNKIVATGGGTPCFFDNMEFMNQKGITVFFDVDQEILFSRLRSGEHRERPLIANLSGEELRDFIKKSLQQRMPYYQMAHLTFNPIKTDLERIAESIQQEENKIYLTGQKIQKQ
ncbi:MAG: shikimate kinase [Chitinophagales bacterium]|nr:shikimate kinase [Chitinophagales bacterium]